MSPTPCSLEEGHLRSYSVGGRRKKEEPAEVGGGVVKEDDTDLCVCVEVYHEGLKVGASSQLAW